MIDAGMLEEIDQHPVLRSVGHQRFSELGIDTDLLAKQRRPVTRRCLDWTQRKHHLGGALGAALLQQMLEFQWVRPGRDTRIVKITAEGHQAFRQHFGILVAQN